MNLNKFQEILKNAEILVCNLLNQDFSSNLPLNSLYKENIIKYLTKNGINVNKFVHIKDIEIILDRGIKRYIDNITSHVKCCDVYHS